MRLTSFISCICVAVCCLAGALSAQAACPPPTVTVLKLPFDASADFPTYAAPTSDPAQQPSGNIAADLAAAFALASPAFQNQLCGLDGIFIDPTGCGAGGANNCTLPGGTTASANSWGFREHPSQYAPHTLPASGHFGRYIAISAGLWNAGTHAPNFDAYQTTLLGQLLNWTSSTTPNGVTPPSYQAPGAAGAANGPGMTVLAALAHEFGHVLFYDTFRPTPGGAFDFKSFCRGSFFENSWRDNLSPPPSWRDFGEAQNEHKENDVQTADLALAISRQNFKKKDGGAANLLHRLYKADGHWASLLGSLSPDEDFVETFVLYTITTASTPVTSLPLKFSDGANSYSDDIAGDVLGKAKKEELRRKIRCFDANYLQN